MGTQPATIDIRGLLFVLKLKAIATGPTTGAQAMLDYLNEEVSTFIGDAELQDDLTIVVLQLS